ncbi:MAG: hypothetical protein B0W54_10200 [Cellvibrio sp. 79]|nr:MAG: hypothetical protein B0W54_10200 [Cellvibrio sp. 79]
MSDKSFDDFLAQQLQRSSSYIEDDGFAANVMASLPVKQRLSPWLERLILAAPVTLIALLVVSQLPWRDMVRPAYGWLLTSTGTGLMATVVGMMLLVVTIPLLWVLRRSSSI